MAEADYLELIDPAPVRLVLGGQAVMVWKCRLREWFKAETVKRELVDHLAVMDLAGCACVLVRLIEIASGWSAGEMTMSEGLAALVPLWDMNELRYIDPYLREEGQEAFGEEWLDNALLATLEATLARRFSLAEIGEMYPEQALVMFQRLKEDEADERIVLFYSTEFGYDQKPVRRGRAIKYKPRPCPYEVPWRRKRRIIAKELERKRLAALRPPKSPFIKSPEKVIDGIRGVKGAKDKDREEDQRA